MYFTTIKDVLQIERQYVFMGLFGRKHKDINFPFSDAKNTATFTCRHVVEESKPILYVSHDADDGYWQFLCGGNHTEKDSMVAGLSEVYEIDKSISDVADLPYGYSAERKDKSSKWTVHAK